LLTGHIDQPVNRVEIIGRLLEGKDIPTIAWVRRAVMGELELPVGSSNSDKCRMTGRSEADQRRCNMNENIGKQTVSLSSSFWAPVEAEEVEAFRLFLPLLQGLELVEAEPRPLRVQLQAQESQPLAQAEVVEAEQELLPGPVVLQPHPS
jgi:hypothetical protein